MEITNFETTGLDNIVAKIRGYKAEDLTKATIIVALKTANISFIAEGINRVQSTLLCELKDSYVQQSQRYVNMSKDSYLLPDLKDEDSKKAEQLLAKAFDLYNRMSKLKENEFKGRPKVENYKYGIPIEDARYIFPLAIKTNISVAMSGDKLYDLFSLFNKKEYNDLFKQFKEQFIAKLPDDLVKLLIDIDDDNLNSELIKEIYKEKMNKISEQNDMLLLDSFANLDLKVGLGAATSTSEKRPSQKLADWGLKASQKSERLAERVLGYGHESIAEQARTTFGMSCSMVTYHQQIRHRLPENHREELAEIIATENRGVVVPPRIKESKFYKEFLDLLVEFKAFRSYLVKNYGISKAFYFILNCDRIKLITATNARIDIEMLAERICLNSQWEIRKLATKKLEFLRSLSNALYEKALPSCIHGKCKEGKLSCGKQKEMRKRFL